MEHKSTRQRAPKEISVEGRLGSVEAALLRGFPPAGRPPVGPKSDEERLQPVGVSIEGGDGAPPLNPVWGRGRGQPLPKGKSGGEGKGKAKNNRQRKKGERRRAS